MPLSLMTFPPLLLRFNTFCFLLFIAAAAAAVATGPVVRDLGVPVKGVSWVRLHTGQTAVGRPSLLASMSQNNGGLFVLEIDLETGHCRQFPVSNRADSTFTPAAYRSLRTGILYIGSAWDAHLHRFDANHPERGVEDLGKIDPGDVIFPTGLTESADGAIWIGSCNHARLVKFDPATGKFTQYGPMDDVDNYLYPLAGDDGSLAALVRVVRPHVIVIDPATGEHREVGPDLTDPTDKTKYLKLVKGVDRRLYIDSSAGKFRIDGMNCSPVDEIPALLAGIPVHGTQRYQAPLAMPGGWIVHFTDDNDVGGGMPRSVLVANTNPLIASHVLHLDWVGGGSNLHAFELGPHGDLYGSSYMPNLLWRARLAPGDSPGDPPSVASAKAGLPVLEDLGKHTFAMGDAYSVATIGNQVYLGSYPEARLSVYDPSKPRRFGNGPHDNPRDLGRPDKVSYRPNALIATPDGKLWMGSVPDYGLIGGTLASYDPATATWKSHRAIVPDTSPASLLYLPAVKQILVGLSAEAGTGVTQLNRHNGLFALWDPAKDELVWSGDLGIENLADVASLAPAAHGLVYALIGRGDHILSQGAPEIAPRLALIDPVKRRLVCSAWLPADFGPLAWTGLHSLRVGPGGVVYGATGYCIFRIKPDTCEVERIWQKFYQAKRTSVVWINSADPNVIDVVGPIIGDQFYFATGWRLRALTLP
jgi:hypothetical protein